MRHPRRAMWLPLHEWLAPHRLGAKIRSCLQVGVLRSSIDLAGLGQPAAHELHDEIARGDLAPLRLVVETPGERAGQPDTQPHVIAFASLTGSRPRHAVVEGGHHGTGRLRERPAEHERDRAHRVAYVIDGACRPRGPSAPRTRPPSPEHRPRERAAMRSTKQEGTLVVGGLMRTPTAIRPRCSTIATLCSARRAFPDDAWPGRLLDTRRPGGTTAPPMSHWHRRVGGVTGVRADPDSFREGSRSWSCRLSIPTPSIRPPR
jgi:hypothetical protein